MSTDALERLRLPARLDALGAAVDRVRAAVPPALGADEAAGIAVAVSEVLTNIVQHGYAGVARPPDIELAWGCSRHWFVVEVRDQGRPVPGQLLQDAGPETFAFDPTDLAALPESGLGLGIVKSTFDYVDYRSRDGHNRIRLGARLP